MDFGIDRLIEMIEQRINRRVADLVLYVLTAAVLVVGLKIIGSFAVTALRYVYGLALYFRGAKAPHLTPSDVLYIAWNVAWLMLLLMIFFAGMLVIRRRINKGVKVSLAELDSIVTDCKAFSDKTHADLHALIENVKVEAAGIIDQAKIGADQLVTDAEAQAKSIILSLQSPEPSSQVAEEVPPKLSHS